MPAERVVPALEYIGDRFISGIPVRGPRHEDELVRGTRFMPEERVWRGASRDPFC